MSALSVQRHAGRLAACAVVMTLAVVAACSSDGAPAPAPATVDAAVPQAAADASTACETGQQRCGGACVDLAMDHDNCGACGNVCGTDRFCRGGTCRTCAEGDLVSCGGTCADLLADPKNCGACGQACSSSTVCSNGLCSATCTDAKTACKASCVDTRTDAANCGGCGHACAAGQTCAAGACTCADPALVACGATCVNPKTDKLHCGATAGCGSFAGYVGTACASGGYCAVARCHICHSWSQGWSTTLAGVTYQIPVFVVADFNKDSKADIAVFKSETAQVTLFLGNGDGTFTEGSSFAVGTSPLTIATGDVDGDGKADLVVGRRVRSAARSDYLTIWTGNGDGTFAPGPLVDRASAVENLAVGDLDGDGRDDIVAGGGGLSGVKEVRVLLASAAGTFTASADYAPALESLIGSPYAKLISADADGDGHRDLIAATNQGVALYFGDGTGAIGSPWASKLSSSGDATVGDIDGDGKLDILVRNTNAGQWLVLRGGYSGSARAWSAPAVLGFDGFTSRLADVTGDGILDLVGVTVTNAGPSSLVVRVGRGDATFVPAETFPYASNAGGSLAVADINGDGRADIVGATNKGIQALLGAKSTQPQCQ